MPAGRAAGRRDRRAPRHDARRRVRPGRVLHRGGRRGVAAGAGGATGRRAGRPGLEWAARERLLARAPRPPRPPRSTTRRPSWPDARSPTSCWSRARSMRPTCSHSRGMAWCGPPRTSPGRRAREPAPLAARRARGADRSRLVARAADRRPRARRGRGDRRGHVRHLQHGPGHGTGGRPPPRRRGARTFRAAAAYRIGAVVEGPASGSRERTSAAGHGRHVRGTPWPRD